jgi:hypothetical protein
LETARSIVCEQLDRERILLVLKRLSEELRQDDVKAEIFLVRGAAIALAYAQRQVTRDLDAIFKPSSAVREAASRIAAELSLRDDWLNDAVKLYLPGEDPESKVMFRSPSLTVAVASPRYLLAMKLLAARVDADVEDIKLLYELCGFTTAEEGFDLVERMYPKSLIPPRTQFLLEELYPSLRVPGGQETGRAPARDLGTAADDVEHGAGGGPSMSR